MNLINKDFVTAKERKRTPLSLFKLAGVFLATQPIYDQHFNNESVNHNLANFLTRWIYSTENNNDNNK